MRFSSPTSTENEGPAFSSITIEAKGGTGTTTSYRYSHYITSCEDTAAEIITTPNNSNIGNKIIRNGQLLIEYNGVYYNTLGQPIK